MNISRIATVATLVLLVASASVDASSIVIDDFGGGPHVVGLGINPGDSVPLTAGRSFTYPGAIGGERDVVVQGTAPGVYFSGVAFTLGGNASFFGGTSKGVIIWDGTEGDPLAVNFGLGGLDFLADCPNPDLHARAYSRLPGAELNVFLYTSASDIAQYIIPLTSVGSFANYDQPLLVPTASFGSPDFSNINAVSMFVDGGGLPALEVYVRGLEVTGIPDSGSTLILLEGGILGLVAVSRKLSRCF